MDIRQNKNFVSPFVIVRYCITASLLVNRWKKASEMNSIAQETLSSLTDSLAGVYCALELVMSTVYIIYITSIVDPVPFSTVKDWIEKEKVTMLSDVIQRTSKSIYNIHDS